MAEDLGEGTEDATPKRRQEARDDGNIARSQDAANAMLLFGSVLVLSSSMKPLLGSLASILAKALGGDNSHMLRAEDLSTVVAPTVIEAAIATAPIALSASAIGVLSHLWQVGFLFSNKPLEPKFERLDPMKGFGRIFGAQGAIKTAMDIFKVIIVGWIAWNLGVAVFPEIVGLPGLGVLAGFEKIGSIGLSLSMQVGAALLVLGLADYGVQRFKHERDLRMTKQQVKDEWKESEGDPKMKQRRMQIARQIAMQRLQTAVPKADVIVTNPEHISVAIEYDPQSMQAPRIVAMGADHVAFRIRQIAMKSGIPIVERKPLARALYAGAKVGQEIPADHYKAVAEILAYVYRLKGKAVA
ncbi:MAG: flagellar biosynthesis protein FlhB [Planctomycetota bacterium]|jgi:flagellar biosynthetic protein FlhB|nr:MAG: flagellar biosynthesis protein FlhB [Planctomycetota bacterium]